MKLEINKLKITPATISGVVELTKDIKEQSIEFADSINERANELANNPELVETFEKETKKEIAAVNKTVKAIKDKAKEINDTLIPSEFVDFQNATKIAEKLIKEAVSNLKAPIDEAKQKRLDGCLEELKDHFDMAIKQNIEGKLTFDMLGIKVIDSNSDTPSKMKKLIAEIDEKIKLTSHVVELLAAQENGELLVKYYFESNLDTDIARNKLQSFLEAQKVQEQAKQVEQQVMPKTVQIVKEVETPTIINNYNVQENIIMSIRFDMSLTHRVEELLKNEGVQILSKEIE